MPKRIRLQSDRSSIRFRETPGHIRALFREESRHNKAVKRVYATSARGDCSHKLSRSPLRFHEDRILPAMPTSSKPILQGSDRATQLKRFLERKVDRTPLRTLSAGSERLHSAVQCERAVPGTPEPNSRIGPRDSNGHKDMTRMVSLALLSRHQTLPGRLNPYRRRKNSPIYEIRKGK
jgi:hypothetical protein